MDGQSLVRYIYMEYPPIGDATLSLSSIRAPRQTPYHRKIVRSGFPEASQPIKQMSAKGIVF